MAKLTTGKAILDAIKRYLIDDLDMTMDEIAEDMCKSRQQINTWFGGKITVRQMDELIKFYKVKIDAKVGKRKNRKA